MENQYFHGLCVVKGNKNEKLKGIMEKMIDYFRTQTWDIPNLQYHWAPSLNSLQHTMANFGIICSKTPEVDILH